MLKNKNFFIKFLSFPPILDYVAAAIRKMNFTTPTAIQAQGVAVLNINALTNSLKPVCLPGEELEVVVVKQGESDAQGVGYLEDGTMVVIEGGSAHVNEKVTVEVTSTLQTSAGRMIFAKVD